MGRALDNDYFCLHRAIKQVWELSEPMGGLSSVDKHLISELCGYKEMKPPREENDLDLLHQVNTSCKILRSIETREIPWLHERARLFPDAINYFIGRIGKYFVDYPSSLPPDFVSSLTEEIRRTKGHLVTTNYDLLLYRALVGNGVLDGYGGNLVDGFWKSGFKPENLERKKSKDFGWYLHLHGSPIYYRDEKNILKYTIEDLDYSFFNRQKVTERQMVLTHSEYKADAIIDSQLLAVYWDFFLRSLYETDKVYLLGYSGCDDHINRALTNWFLDDEENTLEVVEFGMEDELLGRIAFWIEKIGKTEKTPNVLLLDDITKFRWSD